MNSTDSFETNRKKNVYIEASLLAFPFENLQQVTRELSKLGVDRIHIDVMDGHFVSNLSFGPWIVSQFCRFSDLPIHVHLMVADPIKFFDLLSMDEISALTIPYEVFSCHEELFIALDRLYSAGIEAGLALSPNTCTSKVVPIMERIDRIVLMGVSPGFGGQVFQKKTLKKINELACNNKSKMFLQVDGGINTETGKASIEQGANELVVGTALFSKGKIMYKVLDSLKKPNFFEK